MTGLAAATIRPSSRRVTTYTAHLRRALGGQPLNADALQAVVPCQAAQDGDLLQLDQLDLQQMLRVQQIDDGIRQRVPGRGAGVGRVDVRRVLRERHDGEAAAALPREGRGGNAYPA